MTHVRSLKRAKTIIICTVFKMDSKAPFSFSLFCINDMDRERGCEGGNFLAPCSQSGALKTHHDPTGMFQLPTGCRIFSKRKTNLRKNIFLRHKVAFSQNKMCIFLIKKKPKKNYYYYESIK